jgi:hypothetical protein
MITKQIYLDNGYYYEKEDNCDKEEIIEIPEWLWLFIIPMSNFPAGKFRVSKKLFDRYIIFKSYMWFLLIVEKIETQPFNGEKYIDDCCELDSIHIHEFEILYGNKEKYKRSIDNGNDFNEVVDSIISRQLASPYIGTTDVETTFPYNY